MTSDMHDVWYLEAYATVNGEHRGFSVQIRARPTHPDGSVPRVVQDKGTTFLGQVVDMSDLHDYDAVVRGESCDWPYRSANYVLYRNGEVVTRSIAVRPVKPEVVTS